MVPQKWKCKIGMHDFSIREVYQEGAFYDALKGCNASIYDKCEACGALRQTANNTKRFTYFFPITRR